jgi:D-alanyl-D-alanine dipeptidase
LAKGKLVPLKAPEGVRIQKLTHSEPFLHPKAAKTLDKLADRFREKLDGTRESDAAVVVSSVTRTAKQQKEIQARYPNGATQGTSTHSYGASVDLLFVETAGDCYRARKALESTLNELQSAGDLYVCPESKCIHITAR